MREMVLAGTSEFDSAGELVRSGCRPWYPLVCSGYIVSMGGFVLTSGLVSWL